MGTGNGMVALYQVTPETKVISLNKTDLSGGINSISVHPSGNEIICASDKGLIYRISSKNVENRKLHSENHTGGILHVAYPAGVSDRFASASEDGTIRLWDISDYVVTTRCLAPNAGVPICLVYREEVLLSGW